MPRRGGAGCCPPLLPGAAPHVQPGAEQPGEGDAGPGRAGGARLGLLSLLRGDLQRDGGDRRGHPAERDVEGPQRDGRWKGTEAGCRHRTHHLQGCDCSRRARPPRLTHRPPAAPTHSGRHRDPAAGKGAGQSRRHRERGTELC